MSQPQKRPSYILRQGSGPLGGGGGGGGSQYKDVVLPAYQYRIPMLKLRRSQGCLTFNMLISILGEDGLYIETGLWSSVRKGTPCQCFYTRLIYYSNSSANLDWSTGPVRKSHQGTKLCNCCPEAKSMILRHCVTYNRYVTASGEMIMVTTVTHVKQHVGTNQWFYRYPRTPLPPWIDFNPSMDQ